MLHYEMELQNNHLILPQGCCTESASPWPSPKATAYACAMPSVAYTTLAARKPELCGSTTTFLGRGKHHEISEEGYQEKKCSATTLLRRSLSWTVWLARANCSPSCSKPWEDRRCTASAATSRSLQTRKSFQEVHK
ncbi:hypothetical protein CEXT_762561 [Caerostris extrusa]|uniref:Uncharacterized protein n=1 Tax=Caerostris extrusa TaxID=172846 RepID=A0AAV4S650_CAEEX|nr:hypothetical protein CEXT_762561 [Caerostris extrusa]